MKKLIAAIVIASIGAAFADPYYVYEYKASIKRLDISAKVSKSVVTQKYSVKGDTIWGFVTIPICTTCSDNGTINSSLGFSQGYAYLTLKGNSKLVTGKDYQIVKAPVKASIGVFGGDQKVTNGDILDVKKVTKAWMALDFPMYLSTFGNADLVANKNLKQPVGFSFFGLTNAGENPDKVDIQNTGFGTAKVVKGTASFCGGNGNDCLSVSTISGTLVGYPTYQGPCDHTPMWNLCNVSEDHREAVEISDAVICGSWSLKFNESLTKAYASDSESAIIKKFSKASTVFEIKADGSKKEKSEE